MKEVNGISTYKGTMVQQHDDFQEVFSNFLNKIKPKRVLEIGFGTGALTLFLRDHLNELGLHETPIKSYDTNETTDFHRSIQKLNNIELLKDNLFPGNDYTFINDESIINYIQSEGLTLILCDGGNKQREFQQLSKFMKVGDIIMAHDYVDTEENFQKNYYDKIWNWREIGDEHINEVCESQNLVSFDKEIFDKVVWVCKIKMENSEQ